MKNQKTVVVIGTPSTGVIGARALIEQIIHERENPGVLIIPNLKNMDEKSIKQTISDATLRPTLIVAGINDEED